MIAEICGQFGVFLKVGQDLQFQTDKMWSLDPIFGWLHVLGPKVMIHDGI